MGGKGHEMIRTGYILKYCHESSSNDTFNASSNYGHLRPFGGSEEFKHT